MERLIADEMGFAGVVPVSGQTYSRKVDSYFLSALSGIAQSAMKFANDLRIAQSFEELEEPFEKHQIGSSAMPYKRNPMRSGAHVRAGALCDDGQPEPRVHGGHAVVRAHARRLGKQASFRGGGIFGDGRHFEHL